MVVAGQPGWDPQRRGKRATRQRSLSLMNWTRVRHRLDDPEWSAEVGAERALCHGSDSRADSPWPWPPATTELCAPHNRRLLRRPRIRGVAPPRRTNLAGPATPISRCCFSFGCRSRARRRCPTPRRSAEVCESYDRGCRRTREKSLRAASLRILAEESDVDPARVPEATGAPIGGHRRRDGNRLDGVGDQPSPRR